MPEPTGPTRVVTFYSYKGGVGRTMALVNTAHVLAREGWRVLMVDCDLEAPGMTHFFAREVRRRPAHVRKDALDLLLEARRSLAESDRRQEAPDYPRSLAEYVVPIPLPEVWLEKPETGIPYRNGRLDLIPATLELRRSKVVPEEEPPLDYLERLAELDLAGLFLPGGPGHRFGDHVRKHFVSARFEAPGDVLFALRDPVQAAYDVVLIDSRTGLNELAGLSIGTMADALVLCCGLNQQNIEGTRYFMRKAGLFKQRAKPFLIAAGPVPPWHTPEVEQRLLLLRRALRLRQQTEKPFDDLLDTLDQTEDGSLEIAYKFPEMVEIPYHPLAAVRETVFVTELPKDSISQAYARLARRVRSRLLPGALEATEQHLYFLNLLRKPRKEVWQSFGDFTASKLPELRLLRAQGAMIPTFPTACGATFLPSRRDEIRWDDLGRIPVAAAVSALRLSSGAPFERAWALLPTFGSVGYRPFLAHGLIYFQSSTSHPFPEGAMSWVTVQPDGDLDDHRRVLSDICSYLSIQRLLSFGRFQVGNSSLEKLQEAIVSLLPWRSLIRPDWRWIEAPAARQTILELARGVDSLARGTLGEDPSLQQFLAELYRLPASPAQILRGEIGLGKLGSSTGGMNFDRATYSNTPFGFWPEPLAATAVALWKGSKAIQEVLAWLHLARLHYGYAWRVLVDWRYFSELEEHPKLQAFLRQEDEVVDEIEAAIDRGAIPQ